jgi:prolyl-tRNA synthetase
MQLPIHSLYILVFFIILILHFVNFITRNIYYLFLHFQGVPLRIELGPRDLKQNQMVVVRRDTGEKLTLKNENILQQIKDLLEKMQQSLFDK